MKIHVQVMLNRARILFCGRVERMISCEEYSRRICQTWSLRQVLLSVRILVGAFEMEAEDEVPQ